LAAAEAVCADGDLDRRVLDLLDALGKSLVVGTPTVAISAVGDGAPICAEGLKNRAIGRGPHAAPRLLWYAEGGPGLIARARRVARALMSSGHPTAHACDHEAGGELGLKLVYGYRRTSSIAAS
jgi:hypothetical protein